MNRTPRARYALGGCAPGVVPLGVVPLGVVLLGVVLLAGCAGASAAGPGASHQPAEPAATGLVSGRFVMDGGPLGPGGQQPHERPIPGTVTFTAAGHRMVSVTVTVTGDFSVSLPPGQYQVAGRSLAVEMATGSGKATESTCSLSRPVIVRAGQRVAITVACVVP